MLSSTPTDIKYTCYSPTRIRQQLQEYNIPLHNKKRGQNFLIQRDIAHKITSIIKERILLNKKADKSIKILEIGSGLGGLSLALLENDFHVYAIEIQEQLCQLLTSNIKEFQKKKDEITPNPSNPFPFYIQNEDALTTLARLAHFEKIQFTNSQNKIYEMHAEEIKNICSNVPYSISTPLLIASVQIPSVEHAFFVLQEEFSNRVLAKDSRSNSLHIFLHNFGNWEGSTRITKNCFFPAPKVNSSLLIYEQYTHDLRVDPQLLEFILRISFVHKRKTLMNSWNQSWNHIVTTFLEKDRSKNKKIIDKNKPSPIVNIGGCDILETKKEEPLQNKILLQFMRQFSFERLLSLAKSNDFPIKSRAEELPKEDYYKLVSQISKEIKNDE